MIVKYQWQSSQSNLLQNVSWDNSDSFFFMNNISRSFTLFAILAFAFYLYIFCFLSFAVCDWFLVTDVFVWKLFCLYHLSYFVLWWLFWSYFFVLWYFTYYAYYVFFYCFFILSHQYPYLQVILYIFFHILFLFFLNLASPTSLCASYFYIIFYTLLFFSF